MMNCEAAMTLFPTFFSFSPSPNVSDIARYAFVDILINSLALWQEFCLDNFMNIKKSDQHHLGFGLENPQPRLFGSW